ncbi:nicotinamide riboside transporter PnuC [Ancylomarina sp. 16SWW S1-10-2]|uniref:nicotinamide riboside transporter PnuC n=1 Tax=Ancylomarina sp. 16SWW S1-10-2 TaxID=2499681 RepID=UPI0012AD76B0|nr:nicotinamide riboside transporter PnuC [Ancylomarina sp. 16SWW S1-10-2]MRT91387.1 nicotinamide riboside transporter PnuC [Ancylomarina sp. 16SWW S1-10-2]
MLDWINTHIIEIIGTLSGFIYLYFEIKQSKWLWPVGLFSALLYIYVFFVAKFYADMGLQFYYVFISIYGWIYWSKSTSQDKVELIVSRIRVPLFFKLLLASSFIYIAISYVLVNYTDSPLPYWDSFTTALSIVATWMLARKILEQWLVWVLVDAVSMCLYLYKELYPTAVLFAVFTVLALYGYFQWKKDMIKTEAI